MAVVDDGSHSEIIEEPRLSCLSQCLTVAIELSQLSFETLASISPLFQTNKNPKQPLSQIWNISKQFKKFDVLQPDDVWILKIFIKMIHAPQKDDSSSPNR